MTFKEIDHGSQARSMQPAGRPALPTSVEQIQDELVTGPMTVEAVQDTLMLLKKALIERALGAELGQHLGYPARGTRPPTSSDQRNDKSSKTAIDR